MLMSSFPKFPPIFNDTPLDTPGPSRCTCIPPAWKSAARPSSFTNLSSDDHDGRMKARWRGFSTRRNRIVARAARAIAHSTDQSRVPLIAPHHRQFPVTVPLTSTSDATLTDDSSEIDIWYATDEESATPPGDGFHQVTLELKSGHLNDGSQFHQDRSSCTPSYLACSAEQSTRVRDEVAKRPEALVLGVFEDCQVELHFQDVVPHDMVALNSPQHAEVTDLSPSLLFGSVYTSGQDLSPYDNSPSEKDLLRALRFNRHNLILDSPNPSLVPHIVITPPDAPNDGFDSYLRNGVEWQDDVYLWVPPRVEGYGSIWVHSPWNRYQAWPTTQVDITSRAPCPWRIHSYPFSDVIQHVPPLDGFHVFSPSEFEEEIQSASTERLVMYHVIPALHRNLFKVVALQASRIAAEFRKNWDSPEFITSLERPFQWTDPAESLLSYHRNQPRSLILDSTQPFSVPHIIIEEAELQDPYMAEYANRVPSPQDYGFGQRLTVPCERLINVTPTSWDSDDDEGDDFYGQVIFARTSDLDTLAPDLCPDQSSSSSESESPISLATPLDTSWLDGSLFSDEVACKDKRSSVFDEPDYYHRSVSDYGLDEDEDDLPPFDDWYTDIARRSTT